MLLSPGRRVVAVHGGPAAGGEQHGLRLQRSGRAPVRMSIISTPDERLAVARRDQRHRAVLLQPLDRPRPHLLHQPVDDLDAGEVALVHGAVEGLAGEGLAVQRAVGVAVEEAADLVLELVHALDGAVVTSVQASSWSGSHLPPSMVSMKWRSTESPRIERDVVAALHHARAAAFAEQALAGDGDVERPGSA